MKIDLSIFKEYDIRGKYPEEINEKAVYKIAQGFVKFLKLKQGSKIVVGRDKRPSSPKLAKAFISGILDSGINVIDIGKITTPMLYWAAPFLKAEAGIMVTASHNPLKYNGLKFVRKNSEPVGGKDLQEIYRLTNNKQLATDNKKIKGVCKKVDVKKDYFGAVFKNYKPIEIKKLGISVDFDYDADRLIISDKNNRQIRGDIIGAIIAEAVAKKGDVIIYDLRCSHSIPKFFENKRIKMIPSRAGNYNVRKLMREKKSVFGLELTGHYYFKDFYYSDSPLYAMRKLLEQIKKTNKPLEELMKPFLKYSHSGIINIKKSNLNPPKADQISNLIGKLKDKYKNGSQNFTDGLTVEFSNWWFNIRPSHTEPLIRLVVEANSPKLMEEKKKELLREISALCGSALGGKKS